MTVAVNRYLDTVMPKLFLGVVQVFVLMDQYAGGRVTQIMNPQMWQPGFIAEPCSRYLRPGGWLLVNPSHGDAAIAAIDPRYQLVGVVQSRAGDYSVSKRNLDSYLIPKRAPA